MIQTRIIIKRIKIYFLSLTIRITAMIKQPSNITFFSCVDKQIISERHKVKVFVIVLSILFATSLKLLETNHFTHIFDNKCIAERNIRTLIFMFIIRFSKSYTFISARALTPHPLNSVRNGITFA